jgi:formylglycine-generating enzyme required for sulfatase activity/TPR repeat protein
MAKKNSATAGSRDSGSEDALAAEYLEYQTALLGGQNIKEWLAERPSLVPDWIESAKAGDSRAQVLAGLCHDLGVGDIQEDTTEAIRLYRAAAHQGNADAMFHLGCRYAAGEGVPEDMQEAVRWFRSAAGLNNARALWALGNCYMSGEGVPQDRDEGARYLQAASDLGDSGAKEAIARQVLHAILDLEGYTAQIRLAAAKQISENTDAEDARQLLADEQVYRIVRRHCLGFDDDGHPLLNDERNEQIFAEIRVSLYSSGIAGIAANASVDQETRQKCIEMLATTEEDLYLAGVTTLSDEVANAVARHQGTAWLDGLPTLSPLHAQALARHAGPLSLTGLFSLCDEAAEALAGHEGELFLDNVATLSAHAWQALARHKGRVSLSGLQPHLDESDIRSTLALRDAIARAPTVLQPLGHYSVLLNEDTPSTRADFLENDDEISMHSDVKLAVGDYLAGIGVRNVRSFVSGQKLPSDPATMCVSIVLDDCRADVALDDVSADLLRQIYDAAAPATFGDMNAMQTRVDPLVRSGREVDCSGFSVPPALCRWVEQTWAEHFLPASVRAEAYKINLYGPGDRFATHRDTPEKDLVGTFLLALSGWGPPCHGGGLVVHDTGGKYRWDGSRGWAAFMPYLPHEVEPVDSGARLTLAFKVFAAGDDASSEPATIDGSLLAEAANRIALCRNDNGQVGVLLAFGYSLNSTALCGRDLFIYRALERLGVVESVPVAVHVAAEAKSSETVCWAAQANVYSLTPGDLARITKGFKQPADERTPIPFIPTAAGYEVYSDSHASVEWAGNYAEPANVDTLYVHRALIVTAAAKDAPKTVRCAGADLRRCDLSHRNLDDADLSSADLSQALVSRGTLHRANLVSANLHEANLSGAKLKQADLTRANLSGAILENADLTEATLCGTNLTNASLKDAVLHDVRCDAATQWPEGFDLAQHNAALTAPPTSGGQWPDPEGTIVNSFGMKFVPIPAGEFLMGTPGDEGEEFPHHVRITKDFLLGMHQVTQFQYERVTGDNPSLFKGRDRPVEHLSWKDATRFCELLSAMPEEQAAGRRYRLPTEAEWEYACRAGSTTRFNTGETLGKDAARFALKSRTEPKSTKPVGSYPPNAWGLFDMHGNVWEWTNDWFSADYYSESPVEDPQGPSTGTHHTLRGGSASMRSHECRSAFRGEAEKVDGPEIETGMRIAFYGDLGIRLVCEIDKS